MNAKVFRLILLIVMTVQVAAIQPTSSIAAPAQDISNPCAPGANAYPPNPSDSEGSGTEDVRIQAQESARSTRWLPLIPVPAANLVFSDDFDTFGDTRLWRGTDALTPEEEDIWSGPVSIRARGAADGPGAFARKVLGSSYNDISMKVRFKVVSLGPNPAELIAFRGGTDQVLASLEVSADGTLSVGWARMMGKYCVSSGSFASAARLVAQTPGFRPRDANRRARVGHSRRASGLRRPSRRHAAGCRR